MNNFLPQITRIYTDEYAYSFRIITLLIKLLITYCSLLIHHQSELRRPPANLVKKSDLYTSPSGISESSM